MLFCNTRQGHILRQQGLDLLRCFRITNAVEHVGDVSCRLDWLTLRVPVSQPAYPNLPAIAQCTALVALWLVGWGVVVLRHFRTDAS